MIRSATRVTGEVLRNAPDLKVVVRAGTGLDNVDQSAARQCGVAVFNTPAANAIAVAELTFGMMLALERHLVPASTELRGGHWRSRASSGASCGAARSVSSVSAASRAKSRAARAFEMDVVAADPLLLQWPTGFEWVRRATLDDLLPHVDVLLAPSAADERDPRPDRRGRAARLRPTRRWSTARGRRRRRAAVARGVGSRTAAAAAPRRVRDRAARRLAAAPAPRVLPRHTSRLDARGAAARRSRGRTIVIEALAALQG